MRARVVLHENMNEAETAALCVYNLFGAAPDEKALLSRKKKRPCPVRRFGTQTHSWTGHVFCAVYVYCIPVLPFYSPSTLCRVIKSLTALDMRAISACNF